MKTELSLNNFKRQHILGKTLVELGEKYYNNGHVTIISQNGSSEWEFKVKGIEDYYVNVEVLELKHHTSRTYEIKKSTCTCSFNGPFCLHIVAAYHAIYNNLISGIPSEKNVSQITPSELTDDKIVQDFIYDIHNQVLELDLESSKEVITKAFRKFLSALTNAKKLVEINPILTVRLFIESFHEISHLKESVKGVGDWEKTEDRWYNFFYGAQKRILDAISQIKDEQTARTITDLVIKEILSLQDPEKYNERNPRPSLDFHEDKRELLIDILVELSPIVKSFEQIKQLIDELEVKNPTEKPRYMKKLSKKMSEYEIKL